MRTRQRNLLRDEQPCSDAIKANAGARNGLKRDT